MSTTNQSKHRQKARRKYWADKNKNTYRCPDCNRSKEALRTGFEVHHKDGDPANNDPDNLIALCRPCHNIRENKKPSFNELELWQDQLNKTASYTQTTPFITTKEEKMETYEQYEDFSKPFFIVKQISRRKYAEIEIDFTTARGWQTVELPTGREKGIYPQLTEETVEICNQIMEKYDGEGRGYGFHHGDTFIDSAGFVEDDARELAAELRPLVMNRSNWEKPETYR